MNDFETHPIGTAARIEKLEAENKRLREYHEVKWQDTHDYCPNGGLRRDCPLCARIDAIASRCEAELEQSDGS